MHGIKINISEIGILLNNELQILLHHIILLRALS